MNSAQVNLVPTSTIDSFKRKGEAARNLTVAVSKCREAMERAEEKNGTLESLMDSKAWFKKDA